MNRFYCETRPVSLKENQVISKNARFTMLTSRLVRLEYSESGKFEDRASQYVFFRDFPKVEFTVSENDGILEINTDELIVKYKMNEPFSAETLSVKLKNEPASEWHFGEDFEDLGGTAKTLDATDGAIPLGRGVCSRFGFSVIDDSNTLVLGDDCWVELREENSMDHYFFGYGYNYLDAVKDYLRLTGAPPLLPAYALGNWWSRYHKYTQQEYIDLMDRFKKEDIPFSVAVIDMDWHIVKIPEELKEKEPAFQSGWTGYTWNEELFPDYKAFLKYLHDQNLHTSLNLHPAQGVRKHEAMYKEAATAAGIDYKTGKRVPFDILSKKAMGNYFDIIHHPYEKDGVDFWWMDWQQGTDYWWIHEPNKDGKLLDPREKMDPLWMLNHLHILDISRNGKRPMFFSRFSGPGSQRYPVGFSGDTRITWESLKFQPYFTATASNIGYCWWSHDIGGHMSGYRSDDLTIRWMQLGVFSPINRIHSSNDKFLRKEAWCYSDVVEKSIGNWLRFRHQLFPYIYTMNYRCHNELIPLVQPMYYSYPKNSAAYEVPTQFLFGSELMIAPITEPNNKEDSLGRAEVWLPKGDWFDFETGLRYHSEKGRKMEVFRDLEHYPIFAKQGAIVPLCSHYSQDNKLLNDENIELFVFPGQSNEFELYEDSGEYFECEKGAFAKTCLKLDWGKEKSFVIEAAKGDLSLIPAQRNWKINLRGFGRDISVKVLVDGLPYETEASYVAESHTTVVTVAAKTTSSIKLIICGDEMLCQNDDVNDRIFDLLTKAQLSIDAKNQIYSALHNKDISPKIRIWRMGNYSPEQYHFIKAIKELVTLTQELF